MNFAFVVLKIVLIFNHIDKVFILLISICQQQKIILDIFISYDNGGMVYGVIKNHLRRVGFFFKKTLWRMLYK